MIMIRSNIKVKGELESSKVGGGCGGCDEG